ncbi:MAG TPA: hypothetical protein VIK91_12145, partial [Nannocystis sp.]
MSRRRDNSGLTLVVCMLLASLLAHVALWPVGEQILSLGWEAPPLPRSDGWMQVALVPPEEEAPDEPVAHKIRESDPPGQLVKQDRVVKEKAPNEAKYVSEFDQAVEQETRAPNQRKQPGGLPRTPGDAPNADNLPRTRETPQAAPPTPLPSQGPSAVGEGSQHEAPPAGVAPEGPLPLSPGRMSPSGTPGLRGSPGAMQRALGQAGSFDAIDEEVREGPENLLNSRRWKYASFFNRVRDAVAERWHPEQVHAARDPTGTKYGTLPRVTRLFIKLNPDGSIHKITIESSSHLDFLDEEAIRAVRAAAPF